MTFNTYGNKENPSLLLIPGLGVSYEIFLPLIELLKDEYYIVAVGIDGFLHGQASGSGCSTRITLTCCFYTHKLESVHGTDIHFWYGTKEAFVAKPQAEHLLKLCPEAHVEVFTGMNHGQLLVDHPEEIARRIKLHPLG